MAGQAAGVELSPEGVLALLSQDAPGRPLPLLYMLGLDDPPTWRAAVFLLKARAGGFMIAAPHLEGIISFFAAISEEAEGQVDGPLPVVWKVVSVACETSRRRRVGEVSMVLADLSWAHLVYFRRATASRPPAGAALLALTHEETAVRPMPGPAREAADEWVTEQLSDATFLEYATAEELQEDFLEDAEPPEEEDTVESLRARIRQMESAQGAMRAPQPPSHGPRQTRPLLEAVPEAGATLSAEDWQKLRAVAGSPPTRLAGHERAPRATAADNALAEEELEVSEMAPATSTDGALLRDSGSAVGEAVCKARPSGSHHGSCVFWKRRGQRARQFLRDQRHCGKGGFSERLRSSCGVCRRGGAESSARAWAQHPRTWTDAHVRRTQDTNEGAEDGANLHPFSGSPVGGLQASRRSAGRSLGCSRPTWTTWRAG